MFFLCYSILQLEMGKSDFIVVEPPAQHLHNTSHRVPHGACKVAKAGAVYAACKPWKKSV